MNLMDYSLVNNSNIREIQEVLYFLPFETALFVALVFTKPNENMQFRVMEVLLKDVIFEVITQLNIRRNDDKFLFCLKKSIVNSIR